MCAIKSQLKCKCGNCPFFRQMKIIAFLALHDKLTFCVLFLIIILCSPNAIIYTSVYIKLWPSFTHYENLKASLIQNKRKTSRDNDLDNLLTLAETHAVFIPTIEIRTTMPIDHCFHLRTTFPSPSVVAVLLNKTVGGGGGRRVNPAAGLYVLPCRLF